MASSRGVSREKQRQSYAHDPANAQQTWQSLRDDLLRIGSGWLDYSADVADVEETLHETWDELIHAAKVLPATSSEHDRMLTLVLELRELGIFVRDRRDVVAGKAVKEMALMSDGQCLWADLPYFVQEFQEFWVHETMELSAAERESVSVLTAKFCAAGVYPAELACCGLWLLKETLEADRPVVAPSSTRDRSGTALPIIELLPACVGWLSYCNHKLARLSADNCKVDRWLVDGDGEVDVSPGVLAKRSNITQPGFSMDRWLFWRKRLGELYSSEDSHVSQLARKGFDAMVSTGLTIGISIPGEKRYLEMLFQALEEEVAALNYEACVQAKYIKIDPLWATDD